MPLPNPNATTKDSLISLSLVTAMIFAPIVFDGIKNSLRESFCQVVAPADPTSGPGGYVRSQQKAKPAVLTCPYEWMK